MKSLTWEEKLEILQAICETTVMMRKPGDWYVRATQRYIGGDGMLTGEYGNGRNPQEAVEDDFHKICEILSPELFIVVHSALDRKKFRWNGFMWKELPQ